jgi:hypothetical protein
MLQAELRQAQEEAAALRAGNEDVASLQEQLAAALEEASGLRNNNEDVDYLQAQLRRTLRDNVELRHQVRHSPQVLTALDMLYCGTNTSSCAYVYTAMCGTCAGVATV